MTKQEMTIMLGVPSAGHPDIDFINSMVSILPAISGVMIVPRLPVQQARTRIAEAFLGQDYTHLLMIDDDMVFTPGDAAQVLALAEDGKDVVSGLFCRRSNDKPTPIVYDKKMQLTEPPKEAAKVHGTSLAFTIISRRVLEAVGSKFEFGANGEGEDMNFVKEVHEMGFEWWLNPAARIGHKSEITLYA